MLGMVSFKLCDKCSDYGFTKVLHFQMWKTMEQLYQILQTKDITHGNAKEGLYDMFLIFFKKWFFKRFLLSGSCLLILDGYGSLHVIW